MRLLRLDLLAFGPFTDVSLPLDEGAYGLHLVYGPNEAGKSSALRALVQLLYGIPHSSNDNFLHPNASLRIGGVLQTLAGERLECIRRKGRGQTLRGPDDITPVAAERLHDMLAGIDEHAFRQRFGLDYDELVAGGEAIAGGKGELSEVLFAAGSGIAGLRSLQQKLESDADQYFKPRGQNQSINKSIAELTQVKQTIKDLALPTSEWLKHDRALTEATSRKEAVDQQLLDKRAERERLNRIHDALPLIGQRQRLQDELTPLAAVPRLTAEFSDRRRQVNADLVTARKSEAELHRSLAERSEEIRHLEVPTDLLQQGHRIDQLLLKLGSHNTAMEHRPGLEAKQRQLEKDACEILRELGRPADLAEVESLRLGKPEQLRIQELASQHQALVGRAATADANRTRLQEDSAEVRRRLAELPPAVDSAALLQAVQRARREGDLVGQLDQLRADLRQLQEQAQIQLRRLGLWTGSLADLESLAVPSLETVERYEQASDRATAESDSLTARINDFAEAMEECDHRIEQLRLHQDVPTESDLTAAREHREHGWQTVKRVWLDGEPSGTESESPFAPGATDEDLANAYEASVHRADDLADRLRREANQVAEKAQWIGERQKLTDRLQKAQTMLARARERVDELTAAWREHWTPLGISPLSPREMRTWLTRQERLVQSAATIRVRQQEVARLEEKIAEHSNAICQCLAALGIESPASDEPFGNLLDRCETLLERLSQIADEQRTLDQELKRLNRDGRENQRAAEEAQRALAAWHEQWTDAVAPLGLAADASPSQALGVLQSINELWAKNREIESLRERVTGIDRDARHFASEVRAVEADLDLPPRDENHSSLTGLEPTVRQMVERLRHARETEARLGELRQQQQRDQSKWEQAREQIDKLSVQLQVLCQEAGVATADSLPKVEDDSRRRQDLERELRGVEQRLAQLAAGMPLDELLQQASRHDADQLPPTMRQLSDEITLLEAEQRDLIATIAVERQERDRMDGTSRAAEANEQREQLLARIQSDAEQFARLRLATAVLRGAMERYRERNQGPVLQHASELFAELTCGSFEGLRADYNDKGDAVLVGVRPGGRQTVQVAGANCGMSDGTCDQLYLALRLASLETWLERHEPIPFIVDDILIKFDDSRAVAALKTLARLSQRTQVILFTHHQHLLELAQNELDESQLFVHTIAPAPAFAG